MMRILIPMSGFGQRFADAGYSFPKPLIDVNGAPMIQRIVENIKFNAQYIFVVREEHRKQYNLDETLKRIAGEKCIIIPVESVTDGAARTCLLAKQYIDNGEELLIANSDQIVEYSKENFEILKEWSNADGIVWLFSGSSHPKWSFARMDKDNKIVEIAEKKPISTTPTVGIYYFRRGSDFVYAAEQMINKDIRTNGEFYVAPVFNEILHDQCIIPFFVSKMNGIGTPEDLQNYLKSL